MLLQTVEPVVLVNGIYLLLDGQEVHIFLLEDLGETSQVWKNICLQAKSSYEAVCGKEGIQSFSCRTFPDFCLLSQYCQYCANVSLQIQYGLVLRKPPSILHLLDNEEEKADKLTVRY